MGNGLRSNIKKLTDLVRATRTQRGKDIITFASLIGASEADLLALEGGTGWVRLHVLLRAVNELNLPTELVSEVLFAVGISTDSIEVIQFPDRFEVDLANGVARRI